MGSVRNYTRLGSGLVCLFIAFSITTAYAQSFNNSQPDNRNPKLESILLQLIQANDPQDFSRAHNVYLKDGKVRVIIEFSDGTISLPDYVQEETRYGNRVQALVPLEKIEDLTMEKNVTFIRTPIKSYPDTPALTDIPTVSPTLKSGINSTIPLIIFVILLTLRRMVKKE